ncbi:MAG: hypothetical protein K8T26_03200 [Lentisphaerae bacterium]|nr:hypothetical protein [Lentisphaerota bacterium]
MKQAIKTLLKATPLYPLVWKWRAERWRKRAAVEAQEAEVRTWESQGCPAPPPHIVKQRTLLQFARDYQLNILVETGTYRGDTIEAMRTHFDRLYSIELNPELHQKAKERFRDKGRHIVLIQGDSARELGHVVAQLEQPALFWLDGHYSGTGTARGEQNTPIFEELGHILSSKVAGHVVIIDDARCFGTFPDYPTLAQLEAFIRSKQDHVDIAVKHDSIRVTPRR